MTKLPYRIAKASAKWHLDKVFQLEKEYQRRESTGRKKILEAENELKEALDHLQQQIQGHREQAASLSKQV